MSTSIVRVTSGVGVSQFLAHQHTQYAQNVAHDVAIGLIRGQAGAARFVPETWQRWFQCRARSGQIFSLLR